MSALSSTVVVCDGAEVLAALATTPSITLRTASGIASATGCGYWRAVERATGATITVDCADDLTRALEALRLGCRAVAFRGPQPLRAKLTAMASACGATLTTTDPSDVMQGEQR